MKATPTAIPDVLLIEPRVFADARGHFFESFNARDFEAATGLAPRFVQDNQSRSRRGVLRGLHFQRRRPQGKLVRVVAGVVFDVAVDLRPGSPSFGRWVGLELSAENRRQLWIPPGFAHGFLVRSEFADVVYKVTDYYDPADEHALIWNDHRLAIAWPLNAGAPLLSDKDGAGASFAMVELEMADPAGS
ncbi:MAG: dTDP-4-dehydrorhamnose 3,5-epimerase [Pseudomonadota bacterium]